MAKRNYKFVYEAPTDLELYRDMLRKKGKKKLKKIGPNTYVVDPKQG